MLQIDALAAYVICAAGALAGALMMGVVRSDDPAFERGLRWARWSLSALAPCALPLLWGVQRPDDPAIVLALCGSSVTLSLFGWSLLLMTRARCWPGWAVLGTGLLLAGYAWAWRQGPLALQQMFVLGTVAGCLINLIALRAHRRLAGHSPAALALTAYVGFGLLTCVPRLHTAFVSGGPVPVDHLMVPPALHNFYAILYGLMPLMMATLAMGLVNEHMRRRLQARALTDELTGVRSRRGLREQAPDCIARARSAGAQLAVLMVDVDHFKQVNDRHGHPAGDEVLRDVARRLDEALRGDALLARYGGEEFAALVPVRDLPAARLVAERLREAIRHAPCPGPHGPIAVTASLGLSLLVPEEPLEAALERADQALYQAKHRGRDRVELGLHAA